VDLADEWEKGGNSLTLKMRRYRLFMLRAGVEGIPLRPRAAKRTGRVRDNRFTPRRLYGHTYIL
jgi:hypothetical protein